MVQKILQSIEKKTEKVVEISPKQVMGFKVAKGFSEAKSDGHKRNWNSKNGIGRRDTERMTAHVTV